MGIETKTPGIILDELITTDIKCFMAQDRIFDESLSQEERFKASQDTHALNARRNQLIRALDVMLGYGAGSPTTKTYDKGSK
jgi:hypothetical protein